MLARPFVALIYAGMQLVMEAIVRVVFRRFEVLDRERFPRRGPVVLVANHPAAWTDVVVLDVAAGRRLHFLANRSLFRPWWRAVVLRLYGSLPVEPRGSAPSPVRSTPSTTCSTRSAPMVSRGSATAPGS